jgi:hypothetical protein
MKTIVCSGLRSAKIEINFEWHCNQLISVCVLDLVVDIKRSEWLKCIKHVSKNIFEKLQKVKEKWSRDLDGCKRQIKENGAFVVKAAKALRGLWNQGWKL